MISQPLTIVRTNKMGKPYVQSTDPSIANTMSVNDLWLNTEAGTMKAWNGSGWTEMQFGESAIMDDCITNRMLANDISATKITAGILQSQDGSFYLDLETGEAELLNLIMGGTVQGNIIATADNGLTRVRLRGSESGKSAGLIFEYYNTEDGVEPYWQNKGQIFANYSDGAAVCTMPRYEIGGYNSSRPIMGYNAGSSDGLMWRMVSTDWLRAGYYTYHGARLRSRDSTSDSFADVTPVLTAIGQIMTGTAVVGSGVATLTYRMNEVMQVDFNITITTTGSGSDTYGISTSLLRTLNAEIPALTPLDGGVMHIYRTTGAMVVSHQGQTLMANGAYWTPAHTDSDTLTAYTESAMTSGLTIVGTCYATYEFED